MIIFDVERKVFKLDTDNTSYIMGITDEGYLGNAYYGKRIYEADVLYAMRVYEHPFTPSRLPGEKTTFMDRFPMEYPAGGTGDFRDSCIDIRSANGQDGLELKYKWHNIYDGKRELLGLPSARGDGAVSLDICLCDEYIGAEAVLTYSVYEECNVITRSVRIKNVGQKEFYITKALSACVNIDLDECDVLSLHGAWGRERHIQRQRIGFGSYVVESVRGEPGHQDHPFIAVLSGGCGQDHGDIYAMNFVYSGNFIARAQMDQFGRVRMTMGIHPDRFLWRLDAGEEFFAPEAILQYSDEGIGGMTRDSHDFFREYVIPKRWARADMPVLINSWEAAYYDFDDDRLLEIASAAAKLGIEMFVMDDGWFGRRNSDSTSLGDWFVNEEKIKGGLKSLVDRINALGMKFGIWIEPEMVSKDSDLYRTHPDWALSLNGREPGMCRNQFVLDLSRSEVADYVYEKVYDVLSSANIEYVKWDMNRPIAEIGNASLPADRQGEIAHRYVLALYMLQARLIKDFPNLLIENCSAGGARFDAGMLCYSPQIWCSDNTDPIERLAIQEGTHLIYPLSTTGTHVADSPNHANGRVSSFDVRADVALAGTFGYELDVARIAKEERDKIPAQIERYKRYRPLIQNGDYYRIASFSENGRYDCYMLVSKDKRKAVLVFVQALAETNVLLYKIKLKGLDPDMTYEIGGTRHKGGTLMNVGYILDYMRGDFSSSVIEIDCVD